METRTIEIFSKEYLNSLWILPKKKKIVNDIKCGVLEKAKSQGNSQIKQYISSCLNPTVELEQLIYEDLLATFPNCKVTKKTFDETDRLPDGSLLDITGVPNPIRFIIDWS